MTPEQLQRRADRMVAAARAFLADLNDMELRRAFMVTTFNHDLTAAAIVELAGRAPPAESGLPGAQCNELSPQAPDEKPPTPRSDGGW